MGKDNHKKCSAQGDASHKKNYKEYTATVDDIERFLSDNIVLRHNVNVLTGRTEYRVPERNPFTFYLEHLPPFEVESIDSPREKPFDYANIYAQAYALYRQDFRYWFSRTEIEQLALQIVSANIAQKLSTVVLGRAFVEQGFPKVVQRHVRGYLVVRRSAEEMMAMRRMTAKESMEEQVTDGTDIF